MNKSLQRFLTFASVVLVVFVLQAGRAVLIPIALATLLAFLLTPLVVRLRRWRFGKVPAVAVSVALAFSVLGALGWIVAVQVIDLAQRLPDYERNIHAKLDSLQERDQPEPLKRVIQMVDNLRADLEEGEESARQAEAIRNETAPEPEPVPVEVRPARATPIELIRRLASPLLGPLGTAGITVVLLVAMLLQREDLRDRFIKVVSAGRINVATQAVDDAARRVSRYLFLQLVVNATYGLPVGFGLWLIGIPNAPLWGLLATLLRFIPFLGPWVAALFPVTLAAAVAPGWAPLVYTLLLFLIMELVSNNIIEVWLYGSGTGISNLALLVAAVFWTWNWGPIGLFLSTPLTVCLLVIGKYVPGLRFLSMLLGSEPVLEPPAQFYQRMLAMDFDAMLERATEAVERRSLVEFYDAIFVPALILAEEDRHRGSLAEVRQRFIFEAGRDLIDELDRRAHGPEPADAAGTSTRAGAAAREAPLKLRVFVAAARDDADETVAFMLQHVLREHGIYADVAGVTASLDETVGRIRDGNFQVVVISALPPSAVTAARRISRYVREHCPGVRLVVGIWSEQAQTSEILTRLRQVHPDGVATRLAEVHPLLDRLGRTGREHAEARARRDREDRETAVNPPLEFSALEPEAWFDALARDLAQAFNVPLSLVAIAGIDREYWRRRRGLPPDYDQHEAERPLPLPALESDDCLTIEDVRAERRWTAPPFLVERGVRFLACVPLRRADSQTVGRLCVVDTRPRQITPEQTVLLRQRAAEFMRAVEALPLEPDPVPAKED